MSSRITDPAPNPAPTDPLPRQMISGAMDVSSWLILLALALVWGGSFFFIEIALTTYEPLTVVAARLGLGALFLNLYVLFTRRDWTGDGKFWRMVMLLAVTNNIVPFLMIVWGQVYISGSLAAILNATTPLFTMLLANVMTADEKITPAKALALTLGFLGVIIIIGPDMQGGIDRHFIAHLAPLGAAMCYAFSTIYSRRFKAMKVRPGVIAAGQTTVSGLVLVPLALVIDQPHLAGMPPVAAILALLGISLFSTAAAYIAYFHFIAKNGATNMALVTFLVPVSATLLGILFLGEHLEPQHITGALAIAVCFVVLDGRLIDRLRRRIRPC